MDITYITDKVAIMGSFYENDSLNEIRAHMKSRHDKHHTIYNVSSEPEYNIEQDIDNVRNFPFNANNPCALKTLIAICCDMEAYLNVNANNVIFIHCRTGTKYNLVYIHCSISIILNIIVIYSDIYTFNRTWPEWIHCSMFSITYWCIC